MMFGYQLIKDEELSELKSRAYNNRMAIIHKSKLDQEMMKRYCEILKEQSEEIKRLTKDNEDQRQRIAELQDMLIRAQSTQIA